MSRSSRLGIGVGLGLALGVAIVLLPTVGALLLLLVLIVLCVLPWLFNSAANWWTTRHDGGRLKAGVYGWYGVRLTKLDDAELLNEWSRLENLQLPGRPLRGWRSQLNSAVIVECENTSREVYHVLHRCDEGRRAKWVGGLFVGWRAESGRVRPLVGGFNRINHRISPLSEEQLHQHWAKLFQSHPGKFEAGWLCGDCGAIHLRMAGIDDCLAVVKTGPAPTPYMARFVGLFLMYFGSDSARA